MRLRHFHNDTAVLLLCVQGFPGFQSCCGALKHSWVVQKMQWLRRTFTRVDSSSLAYLLFSFALLFLVFGCNILAQTLAAGARDCVMV